MELIKPPLTVLLTRHHRNHSPRRNKDNAVKFPLSSSRNMVHVALSGTSSPWICRVKCACFIVSLQYTAASSSKDNRVADQIYDNARAHVSNKLLV
ncbi:hypothetical protein BaRGS_00036998 [Batillaria attramentaria]|uniref:Uncharacterized protein n=1 Tax=Batillaria attramentaria TaxID=370345 RepID=A0ABD0JAA2_9CAEN